MVKGKFKVIVVGDLMLDVFTQVEVTHVSAEATIPIYHSLETTYSLGGAGHVIHNLVKLDMEVIPLSTLGQDKDGRRILDLLRELDLNVDGINQSLSRMSTRKHRFYQNEIQLNRVDTETSSAIDQNDEALLIASFEHLVSKGDIDAIIFSDYNKGVLTTKVIEYGLHLCQQASIMSFVDPKFNNFFEYKGCTLFKPNFKELVNAFGENFAKNDLTAVQSLSQRLVEKLQCYQLVVTLSENGMFYFGGEKYGHISIEKNDIVDVTGAGDVVMSVLCWSYLNGFSIETSVAIANQAAYYSCNKVGTTSIDVRAVLKIATNVKKDI